MKASRTELNLRKLSSGAARKGLPAERFATLFQTVDRLAGIAEGLLELHNNGDPTLSREARALKYKQRYTQAMKTAEAAINAELDRIEALHSAEVNAGRLAAGLAEPPKNGEEIRAALARLDLKERNRVISESVRAGKGEILAAIEGQPDFLFGGTSLSIADLRADLIEKARPGHKERLEEIQRALNQVEFSDKGFREIAESLRDPEAEARGEEGKQRAEAAEAKLSEVV